MHDGEGDIKIFFLDPWKIIFPEGDARGNYDFSGNKSLYLPNVRAINCLLHCIPGGMLLYRIHRVLIGFFLTFVKNVYRVSFFVSFLVQKGLKMLLY